MAMEPVGPDTHPSWLQRIGFRFELFVAVFTRVVLSFDVSTVLESCRPVVGFWTMISPLIGASIFTFLVLSQSFVLRAC